MKSRSPRFPALALSALAALALSLRADLPPAPQLLPGDTLALVSVPDWTRASEQLGASAGGRLWSDPAMRRFREHFEKAVRGKVAGDLASLGIEPSEFLALLQGQLTVAVIPAATDSDGPGWVAVLDARGRSGELKTRLAGVRRKLEEGGRKVEEVTLRDRAFLRVATDGDGGQALLFGQVDTALVVADSAAPLEKVLARLGGGAVPALGEDEGFRSASGAWFGEAYAYGWAKVPPLLRQATRDLGADPDSGPLPVDPAAAIRALGLDGLQEALFALRAGREGTAVDLSLGVPEARRTGLFRILTPVAADSAPPPFVPATAVTYQRWRIPFREAWTALETALQQASPQLAAVAELFLATAGKERNPDFDLRRSLLGNLGNDMVSYAVAPPPGASDPIANPSLTLFGSPSADALAEAIKTAGGMIPGAAGAGNLADREFNGRTIRAVPAVSPQGTPGGRIEIAAAGGYAAVSSDPALLEGYLRSTEGPAGAALRDDPALRAAAQKVGGTGTGLFGYENQRESVRRQWEFLRSGGLSDSPMAGALPGVDELFRFELLPPFDEVARHFGIAVYAGQADARGLHLRFFSPDPR